MRAGRLARRFGLLVAAVPVAFLLVWPAMPSASASPRSKRSKATAPVPAAPIRQRPSQPLAPSLAIAQWVNSPAIAADSLWGHGAPCVLAFWNAGSESCERSMPAVRELHFLYAKRGLRLFGIHTPGSPREREAPVVEAAAKKWGFTEPVALDNDSTAWKSFKNRILPALHLIDRRGVIRATHLGELRVKTRAWNNFIASVDEVVAETD